jgi:IS1 family transposase
MVRSRKMTGQAAMNFLDKGKQIEIVSALCEGMGIRATARLTNTNRKTVARLALQVGIGAAEHHDRTMTGLRIARLEMDELWSFVAKKQARVQRHELFAKGDQYVFIAMAGTQKAIVSYHVGKRNADNTDQFVRDLRERVIGLPELSTDGFHPYRNAIRDAFGNRVAHGVVSKTYSVVHLNVNEASRRYSPAQVVAVNHDVVSGVPSEISTSYAERGNLSIRMACRRFTRLTNAFSKKLECHIAAVALYVMHYNFCRPHESLTPDAKHQTTPAMALGLTDHVWSISELIDAALGAAPPRPTPTAPERRKQFRVIEGGRQ